jgi:Ca-activated chloride channel homolog
MVALYAEDHRVKFPLDLTYPWMLLALAGLGLVWWRGRESLALFTPQRRHLSLILRCVVVALVVLALTDPRWLQPSDRQHVLWLVDVSRSVGRESVAAATKFMADAGKTGKIASQSIGVFAGQAAILPSAEALQKLNPATLDDAHTGIAQALGFADATFPLGYNKTVVLFSDGVDNEGDLSRQIENLRARGVRVHTISVAAPDNPEVLVRSVTAPRIVSENEPFRVTTEIVSNREQTAQFDLFRNAVKAGTQTVQLKKGVNTFETTQTVSDTRLVEFTAQVTAPKDTVADNNQASTVVQSKGKSRMLLLSDKPDLSRYLVEALEQEDVVLDVRPASGAPNDFADLQSYDLVMIDNVPATDLSRDQMKLLSSYVRDFGGGLIMLGGDQAFGLGGYFRTPIEDILPVRCDFLKEKDNPSLGMVLVMDRSGSMTGPKIEMSKEAAKEAVELLSPQDYVGVVAFDSEAFWVAPMQSAADKGAVEDKISTIQAGGGTNISPGMEMAYAALSSCPAKIKHVILMTDGVSVPGPFYELTTKMAGDQMTVSTVGVGSDADQNLLQQMAEWGNGRYYFTDDPQNIPQIFARETMSASKSSLQETPFQVKMVRPADFLAGVPLETAPYLLGQVLVKVKPTAELWLVSERGDPLLATWRYGLGQTAAFTSDARNRWAVEWLRWEGFGKFWTQLTRKLRRPAALKNFPATITHENDGFRLRVDVVNEAGDFVSDLQGDVLVVAPDGTQKKLSLNLAEPGQLEAFWPASQKGAYHAQILLKRGDQMIEQQYVSGTVGYPDEFSLRPPDEDKLRALAKGTGGKFNPTAAEILEGDSRHADVERELWPWLLITALLAFVGDVAARRWPEKEAVPLAASPVRRVKKEEAVAAGGAFLW